MVKKLAAFGNLCCFIKFMLNKELVYTSFSIQLHGWRSEEPVLRQLVDSEKMQKTFQRVRQTGP
ncbi:hypothetical protein T11_9030 [Trichinella zimbabwensis]|uniref:Uncharacterized protein n=1 Tax=Trichinella zimbabwensis TaxID=268475 RepID=A0A0V1I0X9_9BILA|nr:hypothetical protein T11_9030 [Trichinella zimbabwensis]